MLKALKWLVIIIVGGFIALLALGMVIESNKTPDERAADDARRATEKEMRAQAAAEKKEEAVRAAELAAKQEPQAEPAKDPPESQPETEPSGTEERGRSRVGSFVDRFKEMAAGAEWQFTQQTSPFDGPVLEASKSFESEKYTAEIAVHLRCLQAKRALSVTFFSEVYGPNGITLPSSAFGNTWDISGQPFATEGRVRWANHPPAPFTAMLGEHSNVATLDTSKIVEASGTTNASPSEALESLLPAYFELSNGAGTFMLSIPDNNSSVNKVLAACR